jgi:hypothetical protein
MIERPLSEAERNQMRKTALENHKSFTKVYLSVSAAAKMLNHAVSGVPNEVMGMTQGFYQKNPKGELAFQITDIVYLPAKASETRVTADTETQVLMACNCGGTQCMRNGSARSMPTTSSAGTTLTPAMAAGSPALTSRLRTCSRR